MTALCMKLPSLYWMVTGGSATRAGSEATLEAGSLTAVDDSKPTYRVLLKLGRGVTNNHQFSLMEWAIKE